jgi:hypothetical protein
MLRVRVQYRQEVGAGRIFCVPLRLPYSWRGFKPRTRLFQPEQTFLGVFRRMLLSFLLLLEWL